MSSWVSVLSIDATIGHAALAVYLDDGRRAPRYEVFHLVLTGDSFTAIERLRWGRNDADPPGVSRVVSAGGSSPFKLNACDPLPGPDWYQDPLLSAEFEWMKARWIEGPRLEVSAERAQAVLDRCFSQAALGVNGRFRYNVLPTGGRFGRLAWKANYFGSMAIVPNARIGGNVAGENCMSWVYATLRASGITFTWGFYLWSFLPPAMAVRRSGQLALAPGGRPFYINPLPVHAR